MQLNKMIKDNCILVLYDSYSSLSINGLDKDKFQLVDVFKTSALNDIIKNIEFLFKVSKNDSKFSFVIINTPDSSFLYKVAI